MIDIKEELSDAELMAVVGGADVGQAGKDGLGTTVQATNFVADLLIGTGNTLKTTQANSQQNGSLGKTVGDVTS